MELHNNKLQKSITIGNYTRPCLYFSLVLFVTFVFELMSAYISQTQSITRNQLLAQGLLLLMGMVTPMTIAFIMVVIIVFRDKGFFFRSNYQEE